MADISRYLQAIMTAVYGEDVRGSIHDAIEIINEVGEVVLTTGTAVTSASSSSTGFFENSLYLNTDTLELWKCIGTDTWESQGVLKGDPGDPGEDGNRWFRGTGISGKAVNPTVYSSSGVADANPNDFYLNPSEGAVYHCVTGGDASTATWSYDFTMTGGGGGGSIVTWTQIQATGTKIATIVIDGSPTDVYAPTGGGSTYTASKGVKLVGTDIRADLKSDTAGSLSAAAKGSTSDREYAVGLDSSGNLSVNVPWTDTTYENKAAESGGTEVSLVSTGEKYEWNNKAGSSDLDGWTSGVQTLDGSTFVFDNLDDTYGYDLFGDDKLYTITNYAKTTGTTTGTVKLTYTVSGASIGDYGYLRIFK